VKPPEGATFTVNVAACPAVAVTEVGVDASEKSPVLGGGLVPVSGKLCGLPEALSATLMLPLRVPEVVGLKVTLMPQLAPAATEAPHVLVSAKSPLAVMLVIVNAALPVLVSVTVCAALVVPMVWLAKVSEVGEKLTAGAGTAAPVPVSVAVCGLPAVLSTMLNVPVRVPAAVGLKVTLIVQLAPAATEVPQVSLSAKSPVAEMLVMLKAMLPVLDSITLCAALVVPTI
jgi:hypothetical protein